MIIGGGIIGCSIAYHLTAMGETDVVLLEQHQLTDGATWHAAGLVGQLRSSRNTTRMLEHSVELYGRLEAETGQAVDWHQVGSLRLACSPERVMELKRLTTMAKSFGLPMEIVSPQAAQELFPLMTTEDVLAAAFLPTDGYIDPASVTQAIAKGARDAQRSNLRAHPGHVDHRRRSTGDHGPHGSAATSTARWSSTPPGCGAWRSAGWPACASLPSRSSTSTCSPDRSTDFTPAELRRMPTMRDPDHLVYYKPDGPGLLIGGYEPDTLPFGRRRHPVAVPAATARPELRPLRAAGRRSPRKRTPVIEQAGIRTLINGPIPYSADADFVMGRVPELDNYYVATGFLYGIAAGGGAGKMMAEWILEGRPSLDLWPLDVRRFAFHHTTHHFMGSRMVELYAHHYKLAAPGYGARHGARRAAQPAARLAASRTEPCSDRAAAGSGPNWFAPSGVEPVDRPSFGEPNWFDHVGDEHRAVRERVALIDQTSFAKFEITGPGRARRGAVAVGRRHGQAGRHRHLHAAVQRARRHRVRPDDDPHSASRHWYVVTGSAFGAHDMGWIRVELARRTTVVQIRDLTSAGAVINLCGPLARDVLQAVCEDDVSNESLPRTRRHATSPSASAPVLAMRIGYVGELGWELHVPTEYAAHVYELLREAGEPHGIVNVGYRAIDTLRMEKGYLYWSTDITPDTTPWEAGLGWRVNLRQGRLLRARRAGRAARGRRRLASCARSRSRTMAYPVSGEAIIADGEVVGFTTSANFGHTIGKPIAYGYLPVELADRTDFVIEVYGEPIPATRHDGALYDPKNARLKA